MFNNNKKRGATFFSIAYAESFGNLSFSVWCTVQLKKRVQTHALTGECHPDGSLGCAMFGAVRRQVNPKYKAQIREHVMAIKLVERNEF